ncbi:MAG: MFS transporter [Leptospiraceae bacterium]|nr:MFS transporter [Leptospiraceae bacterium]MDW8305838.1 MFS transporter [Leptospiraceae bacterium]
MRQIWEKTGYALAETGIFAQEFLLRLELLKFYQEKMGVSAYLVGIGVALGLIWDALSDPIMGYISDHTQSRWGNRRPYLLAGGVLLAICNYFLFHPPDVKNSWLLFFYLVIGYLALNTALTVLSVPHAALSGELAFNPQERVGVFVLRFTFGNLGLFVALLALTMLEVQNASRLVSTIVFFTALISFFAVRKVPSYPIKTKIGLRKSMVDFFSSLKVLWKNGYFRPLVLAYTIAYTGIAINSATGRYYYEYFLGFNRQETGVVLIVFLLVWTLSLVLWSTLARRLDKKTLGFWGVFLLGIMTTFGYPLFPAGKMLWPILAAVVGGLLVGSIVLLDSLVADIVDYDELKTREHREGLYFGLWKMAVKLSRALGLFLSGLALSAIGVDQKRDLSAASGHLGLLFGPGVGLFFILGAIVFLFMPLTAKRHERIQNLLVRRLKLTGQKVAAATGHSVGT